MWAAEDKQYDATQLLIEQGANVHIRDEVRLECFVLFCINSVFLDSVISYLLCLTV